jgi:hypothetical protein
MSGVSLASFVGLTPENSEFTIILPTRNDFRPALLYSRTVVRCFHEMRKEKKKMFQRLVTCRNAGPVANVCAAAGLLIVGLGLVAATAGSALAATTITGTVETSGKYLVTGTPVTTTAVTTLKLSFENKTPGTNLELCAGTAADFAAGTCSTRLSDSGGPGFVFLTITDTAQLSGKILFVLRAVGVAAATFELIVD